jgi:hypothetical protein
MAVARCGTIIHRRPTGAHGVDPTEGVLGSFIYLYMVH